MIQTLSGNAANIHTRTLPDSLQTFQYRNTAGIIGAFFCHIFLLAQKHACSYHTPKQMFSCGAKKKAALFSNKTAFLAVPRGIEPLFSP